MNLTKSFLDFPEHPTIDPPKQTTSYFDVFSSPPMSPNKVAQCVQNIRDNEKLLFNEHLAMVFPGEYKFTFISETYFA